MTEFTGIAYEPHPVTPERKAELRAQGLRIIDIQFQPATTHADADSPSVEMTALDFSSGPVVEPIAPAAPVVTKSPRKSKP